MTSSENRDTLFRIMLMRPARVAFHANNDNKSAWLI